MIDLTIKGLPTDLEVGGESFPLDTDFRTWIRWVTQAQTDETAGYYIFTGDIPSDPSWVEAALDWASCRSETPKGLDGGPRLFDYTEDAARLVAAFQQCYGIDLTECDMHWWRFRALLDNLPDGTALGQVMRFRAYTKPSQAKDAEHLYYAKMKRAYALPPIMGTAEREAIEIQKEAFGLLKP